MKKLIHYITIIFVCIVPFVDVKAQYKIEEDGWGGQYDGRLINIGFHTCGTFFDKVPLSLSTQYQSNKKKYLVCCALHLYAPKEFPPEVLILLKNGNGEIIELSGKHIRGGTEKQKVFLDGKPYFRYQTYINFELSEEKIKELILAKIIKIRFQTETTPIDKIFYKNEFSNELEKIYSSIQRRLHPEWFRDEVREGF